MNNRIKRLLIKLADIAIRSDDMRRVIDEREAENKPADSATVKKALSIMTREHDSLVDEIQKEVESDHAPLDGEPTVDEGRGHSELVERAAATHNGHINSAVEELVLELEAVANRIKNIQFLRLNYFGGESKKMDAVRIDDLDGALHHAIERQYNLRGAMREAEAQELEAKDSQQSPKADPAPAASPAPVRPADDQ
jgi:hypothetical protein